MSRTLQQITLFVSGTSETDSEKAALRRIVEDLNRRLEKTHAVTLRVIGWPDDFRPGVNLDPQAEINRQVGSGFDIYVGILGTRFGTPTPRAGSGTEEEFEDAIARFRTDSRKMRVLVYFKKSTEDPFSIDIGQLEKVRKFRDQLSPRGVVYKDFKDTTEFIALIQNHIYDLIVDEWKQHEWSAILPANVVATIGVPFPSDAAAIVRSAEVSDPTVIPFAEDEAGFDEELGFLDYMEAFHDGAADFAATMENLTKDTQQVGEQMTVRNAELQSLLQEHERRKHVGGDRIEQEYVAKGRALINRAAGDLDEFVKRMTARVDEYRLHNRRIFENFGNAMRSRGQLMSVSVDQENRDSLLRLITALQESREITGGFQMSVSEMPALTGKFKRARRNTAAIIGELVAEMSLTIDEARRALDEFYGPSDQASTA